MKKAAIMIIRMYQYIFSSVLKQVLGIQASCRYSPSCSSYAMQVIEKTGVLRGSARAFTRILRCNALFT